MAWGSMKLLGTQSSCNGCEKRVLHCRNTCEKWAEYEERANKERAARIEYAEKHRLIKDYIVDKRERERRALAGKARAKIDKKHR